MPKIFLLCLLFFCVSTAWPENYQRVINWNQEKTDSISKVVVTPGFTGAVTLDHTGLPYWFESFELNSKQAEVSILNATFEPIDHPSSVLSGKVGNELKYSSEVGISSGKAFLRVTVFPFILKNSRIEKLTSFTLSVKEIPNQLKSASVAYPWKTISVLASGKWIKIKTGNRGIYKISTDQLKQWGFPNPDQVVLYGSGGYMLPTMNKNTRFDDLPAYPVWKGKDNSGKDCIFFFSTGNVSFSRDSSTGMISHQQNYYATATYFYLSDTGTPNVVNKIAELADAAGKKIISFPNYAFYEKEAINLISSGSQWFGEQFIPNGSQTISLTLDNPDLTKQAQVIVSAAGKFSSDNLNPISASMSIIMNGQNLGSLSFKPVVEGDATADFADGESGSYSATLPSKSIQVKLTFNCSSSSSEAWLDYVDMNYQSQLNMSSDVYFFRGQGADGIVSVSEFVLSGATSGTKIIDVTDINNSVEIPTVFANGQMSFKSNSTTVHEYIAFNPAGTLPVPDLIGDVANQNLHATNTPDMIVVSNSALLSAANDLANFHRTTDGMTVQVVTPEMVYNEFSGGLPDPAGIRNYFRMYYDKGNQAGNKTLKYVLLMGDGSFDNRNILGMNQNLIPTYQSDNSLSPVESFVTDDFFGFMDENEGGSSGTIDLGIGRIPAQKVVDAQDIVDKIKNYNQQKSMGNWRNVVTFIADDKDNSTHMAQAESLADFVNQNYPAFYTDKIYLDAYKEISTPSGQRYPDVNIAINNRVKQGTLVMNYTGHANEKNLADEDVLDIAGINSWTNSTKLPVFVTATCEFSRFDGPDTSAGEYILLNPIGGGVGLFSTTRLVYSPENFVLNSKFFKYIFKNDQNGNRLRLGDVMRLAKAEANTGANQLNFTLLADPAMKLADPAYQVITSSIDGKDVETSVDTIRTLSVVTVKGFIADANGVKQTSFNGEVIPTVYDKAMQVETLGNAGQTPMSYTVQNNIIYKGLASVTNGEFEFSFFVPKDISYKLGKGKILYYAYNETNDAQGYFNNFYVGGSSNTTISDGTGPSIDLFLNSESFKDGDQVSASSVLLANISDANGINTSGTGIGHDITAILDGDNSSVMVLNDYFQSDKDSYTSGKIVFPLSNLAEGNHVLTLKVWDVLNNSSEKEIHFAVKDDFRMENVHCYPNPMQGETKFAFTHNQPDETFDVNLEVFQTSGARVDLFQTTVASQGTESMPIDWIPANRQIKMRAGVYIYRITATTKSGKTTSGSGRLVYVYK